MYIPPAFNVTDRNVLFDFIEAHSFGVLVSQHNGSPFATHLPILSDRNAGPHGQLISHMARANPQWTRAEGQMVLAMFSGPHAYISPSWYAVPNAVPTWNYAAVHVSGIFETINDADEVLDVLSRTVKTYERARQTPWIFDASNDFYKKMAGAIVAFRIQITSIEGKLKLNQNRPVEQRERVVSALSNSHDQSELAIAELMRQQIASEQ